jgi:hypothetical protein
MAVKGKIGSKEFVIFAIFAMNQSKIFENNSR